MVYIAAWALSPFHACREEKSTRNVLNFPLVEVCVCTRADYWLVVGMQVKRKVRGEALPMHAQTTNHFLSVTRTHTVLKAANVFSYRVNVF